MKLLDLFDDYPNIKKFKRILGILVIIVFCICYAIVHFNNKKVANNINNRLLSKQSVFLNHQFNNPDIVCVFTPYASNIEYIKEVRDDLMVNQIKRINRNLNSLIGEDTHWDLVVIKNRDYQMYQINLNSIPDFESQQCVFANQDKMELYPLEHGGERVKFELR